MSEASEKNKPRDGLSRIGAKTSRVGPGGVEPPTSRLSGDEFGVGQSDEMPFSLWQLAPSAAVFGPSGDASQRSSGAALGPVGASLVPGGPGPQVSAVTISNLPKGQAPGAFQALVTEAGTYSVTLRFCGSPHPVTREVTVANPQPVLPGKPPFKGVKTTMTTTVCSYSAHDAHDIVVTVLR
jgi:hypothetical protein